MWLRKTHLVNISFKSRSCVPSNASLNPTDGLVPVKLPPAVGFLCSSTNPHTCRTSRLQQAIQDLSSFVMSFVLNAFAVTAVDVFECVGCSLDAFKHAVQVYNFRHTYGVLFSGL